MQNLMNLHGTTILAIRRDHRVAVAGDGQVTMKDTIMKHRAKKVRKIYQDKIIVGFAGATADALNLYERFEGKLEQFNGNLTLKPFQCRVFIWKDVAVISSIHEDCFYEVMRLVAYVCYNSDS